MSCKVAKVFNPRSPLDGVGFMCSAQNKEKWSVPGNPTDAQKVLESTLIHLWLPAFDDVEARTYAAAFNYGFAPGSFVHLTDTAAMYDHGKRLFDYFSKGIELTTTPEDELRMRACQSLAQASFINGVASELLVSLPNQNHLVTIDGHEW